MTRSPHLNRRQLLTLAGATAATGIILPRSWADPHPDGRPSLRRPGLPQIHVDRPYRPLPVSDPRELPNFPADANPVRWRWSRASHTTIQDAIQTLGPNDVLVLPEDDAPYEIDTSRGFKVTRNNYHSMAHVTRGIAGLGPNAVIRPASSAFRKGRQTYSRGLQAKMIESRAEYAYLGNFTMYGRDFGGAAYNATWASGRGTVWERIYFRGAHRGWYCEPPGEAAAICGYRGSGMQVFNCEIDCRDEKGNSVGTSPLMWNAQSDVHLTDVYAHHTYMGMPTFWKVQGASVTNLIHRDVAQGRPFSPGVNVISSSGRFRFTDCTFIIDYGTHNHGHHLNTGGQTSSVEFDIRNPTIDAGPFPGEFSIYQYDAPAQRRSDYNISKANGDPYPFHITR